MTLSFTTLPGFSLLSRLLAAVLGGYALASSLAVLLGSALPAPRAEAVLAGIQWSFAVYVAAVIWAFSPVSLARVWAVLLALTAALLVACGLLSLGAGG